MKTKKEEAQLALELCNKIAQLESILWTKYDKEFIELIFGKDNQPSGPHIIDDPDIYPF
jgi:hypothetical protein